MPFSINNETSFAYLNGFHNLELPELEDRNSPYAKVIEQLKLIKKDVKYNEKKNYNKIYTRLHHLAAKIPFDDSPNDIVDEKIKNFHLSFFELLYENNGKYNGQKLNEIIHNEIGKKIEGEVLSRHELIKRNLAAAGLKVRKRDIAHAGHPFNEAKGIIGVGFNPLKETNKPYIPFDPVQGEPLILRFGTQIKGYDELQPSFLNYLAVKKAKEISRPIHHIYFNLMKRPVSVEERDFARKHIERDKVATLEGINKLELNAEVITLPAAGKYFTDGFSLHEGKAQDPNIRYSLTQLKKTSIESILYDQNDFFISQNVKSRLENFEENVENLFVKSAQAILGSKYKEDAQLTAEQRQAILFEFIKFRLPRYIISEIMPATVNFSCKDAIDRGGVNTLYYEFRRRLESNEAMSEDEFNMNLDASALLVKARPANENRHLLWNALYHYYLSNKDVFNKNELAWVKPWLEQNAPPDVNVRLETSTKRVKPFISKRPEITSFTPVMADVSSSWDSIKASLDNKNNYTESGNKLLVDIDHLEVKAVIKREQAIENSVSYSFSKNIAVYENNEQEALIRKLCFLAVENSSPETVFDLSRTPDNHKHIIFESLFEAMEKKYPDANNIEKITGHDFDIDIDQKPHMSH